jgi:hypothetical protein
VGRGQSILSLRGVPTADTEPATLQAGARGERTNAGPRRLSLKEDAMPPKTSRDMPGNEPRVDKHRDEKRAEIKDADKTETVNRDKVHGDGKDIGIGEEK